MNPCSPFCRATARSLALLAVQCASRTVSAGSISSRSPRLLVGQYRAVRRECAGAALISSQDLL